jgi:hypothetical protein
MVLAREEDVADAYATIGVLKCGADFARRVLVEAAKGWFLSDVAPHAGNAAASEQVLESFVVAADIDAVASGVLPSRITSPLSVAAVS